MNLDLYFDPALVLCFLIRTGIRITVLSLCDEPRVCVCLGALGPVDGMNPELSNLTCSMTEVSNV